MTQKELGLAIGFEEKGAITVSPSTKRITVFPKGELLDKIAEVLRVDRQNFYTEAPGCAEDFMRTFFWLDEDSPGSIRLFQLVRNPGKTGPLMIPPSDTTTRTAGLHTLPWAFTSNYGLVDEFMREWLLRQQELHTGEITREEYFEWKLNWPRTCDSCGKCEPSIPWHKVGE